LNGQQQKIGRGTLSVSSQGVAFAENFQSGQGSSDIRKLAVSGTEEAGSGALSGPNWEANPPTTETMQFGFNADYFCRDKDGSENCFNRDKAKASQSVWRYGLYDDETGARFNLGTPGFTIKTANDEYGFASYHGIYLSGGVQNGATVTKANNATQTYTIMRGGGKMYKKEKLTRTIDECNKIPFRFRTRNTVEVAGTTYTAGTDFEAHWDKDSGGTGQFLLTGVITEESGWMKKSISVAVSAATLNNFTKSQWEEPGIEGWSEALAGASVQIEAAALTASPASVGTFADGVLVYARTLVLPGETIPTSLVCVSECPLASTILTYDPAEDDGLFKTGTDGGYTLKANAETYTWDSATYELKDSTSTSLLSSNLANLGESHYTWGFRTTLAAQADLASVECESANTHYCLGKVHELSTYYEWEMGPNEWNYGVYLKDSSNAIVAFTPPLQPSFHVPDNIGGTQRPYGGFADIDMQLHYQGFGELHGIPAGCFNVATNEPADCGPGTRYVSSFAIPYGADGYVTIPGGGRKWVKWLERELRLRREPEITSTGQSITLGNIADLPATPPLTGADPMDPSDPSSTTYAGVWSDTVWLQAPAVIHTVAQSAAAVAAEAELVSA
jgi:hypothetical protein